jgi:hypothetical protein
VRVVTRAPSAASVIHLECVHDEKRLEWAVPARVERTPADAQVILVCVRYEYLDAVVERVASSAAPVVIMTPLMPQDLTRLSAAMPNRVVVAMPSVTAYQNAANTIRYWLPHGSVTLVEATPAESRPELVELIAKLEMAGIAAKLEPNVLTRAVATTMSILPLAMAIDAAGGLDAALEDDALLSLAQEAAEEGRRLGSMFGKAEWWATLVPRFAGPRLLRAAAGLTRARFPETLTYVQHHFAHKLHEQNLLLSARILELAKERGGRYEALRELRSRLTDARV